MNHKNNKKLVVGNWKMNPRTEKEALELDRNVKARILSNPRSYHNKEMIIDYGRRLKEIEFRLREIEKEIPELKSSFIETT